MDEENSSLPALHCTLRTGNAADEKLARDVAEFVNVTGSSVSALIREAVRGYIEDWKRGEALRAIINRTMRNVNPGEEERAARVAKYLGGNDES